MRCGMSKTENLLLLIVKDVKRKTYGAPNYMKKQNFVPKLTRGVKTLWKKISNLLH
jgi:hypothetical protein